jgi:hypothetical protein
MIKRLISTVVSAAFAVFAGVADANFSVCSGLAVSSADLIAIQINPAGAHLADPALQLTTDSCPGTVSAAGWVQGYNDGAIAIFTGPETSPAIFSEAEFLGTAGEYAFTVVFFSDTVDLPFATSSVRIPPLDYPPWETQQPTRAELDALLRSNAPEPISLALIGIGAVAAGAMRRRKEPMLYRSPHPNKWTARAAPPYL